MHKSAAAVEYESVCEILQRVLPGTELSLLPGDERPVAAAGAVQHGLQLFKVIIIV